jgi:putative ABC transport system substrate-binding protein
MLPNIRRIAVLRDLNTPRIWAEATEETGRRLGLALQSLEVAEPETFESAFEAAVNAHAEALDVLASAFFNSHKARLTELAAKYRLPTMYEHDDFVRTGGLMAYGPSIPDLLRRAATHVDKILKGAKHQAIYQSNSRLSLRSASTSRPPRRSASKFLTGCWPLPTR